MKSIISLITFVILSLGANAGEVPSTSELLSISTISPFLTTTEGITDLLTKSVYEEASDIVADGKVTKEELDEMSVELKAEVEYCNEGGYYENEEDPVYACLSDLALAD